MVIRGFGDVPTSIKFDLTPKRCFYRIPAGARYEGIVSNVTPNLEELSMYELAEHRWFAGVTLKIICQNLRQLRREPEPEGVQADHPAPRLTTGEGNSSQSITDAQAAACVDLLWANTTSKLQQAHVEGEPILGESQLLSQSEFRVTYLGSPTDTNVLNPAKTGAKEYCPFLH